MAGRSAAYHTAGLTTSSSGVQTASAVAAWANDTVLNQQESELEEDEEQQLLLSSPSLASSEDILPLPSTLASLSSSSSAATASAAIITPPNSRRASQRKQLKAKSGSGGTLPSSLQRGEVHSDAAATTTAAAASSAALPAAGASAADLQATPVRSRPVSQWAVGVASSVWGGLGNSIVGRELQALLPMAAPVMAASCLTQLLNIVDLMFVGNFLGTEYLAAAALGNCWFNILSALFLGGSSGIDQLCSAATLEVAPPTFVAAAGGAAPLSSAASSPAGGGGLFFPPSSPRPRSERGRGYTVLTSPGGATALALPTPASSAQHSTRQHRTPSLAAAPALPGSPAPAASSPQAAAMAMLWAQRGVFLMALLSIPLMLALSLTEEFLVIFGGQDIETSFVAAGFCDSLVIGLLPLTVSTALSRYLGSQGVVWPGITVDILANLLNLTLNAALISQDGFLGAPLATSVARVAHLSMLLAYLRWRGDVVVSSSSSSSSTVSSSGGSNSISSSSSSGISALTDAPLPPTAAASSGAELTASAPPSPLPAEPWWDSNGLSAMAKAMVTGAFIVALESWPLEVSNLIAGRLDVPSLDAHTVMLNTCVFISLGLPTGVGVAASSRIPALLSAGDALGARKTALVAILTSLTYNLVAACALLGVRGHMGALFTADEEVAVLCAHTALIAALFQLADGTMCVLACVLRGLQWSGVVTALIFFGWTAVGLPLAWFLAFHVGGKGWGLFGLWVGLLVGMACIMLSLFAIFRSVDWDVEAKRALEARRWQEEQRERVMSSKAKAQG